MKEFIIFALLFFAVRVFAETHVVEMKSLSYTPKQIEIKAGDEVEWKNVSYTEHSATGDAFDTGKVQPKNVSKKIAFKKAGTFDYHCQVHGKTMSGSVVVTQ